MLIQENVPLADKNWFCTGGDAKYFCQPTSLQEFKEALEFAATNNLDIEILGKGANVLISDDGFDGLLINPALTTITQEDNLVTAGAGCEIQECIDWCLDHNLSGLEEFSGIPGSIGGAVYINVHYFKFFISDFLVRAQIINKNTFEILTVDHSWFNFGYDQSKLHDKTWFLLTATFKLTPATDLQIAYAKGRRDEMIRHRQQRYPTARTCGSFFRNFHDHELKTCSDSKKLPYIAYYLDKLGVKGELSYGNAIVSHQHANMLVTRENATSYDVVMLARKLQELVRDTFGILPQSECQFIGFKKHPLELIP